MSKLEYKIEIPLFNEEVSSIWKDMPKLISGILAKKQDALEQYKKLDTAINGGELKVIGKVFGQEIYARINDRDSCMAEYQSKRLASMMMNFMSNDPEEIVLDGKRYIVVLKEQL